MQSIDQYKPSNTPFDFTKYDGPYEVDRKNVIEALIPVGDASPAVDIGCGPGYFTMQLSSRGWKTTSIDSDSENIANASQYADESHVGDASSVLSALPGDHYGFAVALEIIEHMPPSRGEALLKHIHRVLKPGGRLIISTPNRFSPEGLGGYYWSEKIRRAGKWQAWDSTHVHIYSSGEILHLLKLNGFLVDRITGYYYAGRLPVIGRWQLPLKQSKRFPFNRMGFNVIVECHKQ